MKKMLLSLVAVSTLTVSVVQAEPICEVKNSLMATRATLLELLSSTDKEAQKALKTKIDESSVVVDETLKTMMDSATEDTKAKLTQFTETWTAFKETRQKEVFPAIEAGKAEDAKAVATGVQAERVKTMNELVTALGGDKCEPPKEEAKK
jgi:hypothetical protein